jgi:hypothetical protein
LSIASPATRRSRGPVLVYTAVATAVLVVIAAVALTTGGAAPPSIAAYAPQSIQQIKHAPPNQSGNAGNPGGAHQGKTPTPSPKPSTPPPPPKKPLPGKTFTCVGHPPRQTADPQSPPCVSSWRGKNGGSTAPGVTANEIRAYLPPLFIGPEYTREVNDLQQYFNEHFEFYGRTLNLDPQATGGGAEPSATGTCSDIQAQADWVAKELNVFAAADDGSDSCWYDELGRKHVISLSGQTTSNADEQAKYAPYLYSYPGVGDDLMDATGQFICSQLAGKDATYSTNPLYKHFKRSFGLIESATLSQIPTPSTRLEADLAGCGVHLVRKVVIQATGSDNGLQSTGATTAWALSAQNAVVKMNQAQVTTVICFCQIEAAAVISASAQTQLYRPEWITERSDQNLLNQGWLGSAHSSQFEVSALPMQTQETASFYYQALQSVDPGFCPCATSLDFLYGQSTYEELMMLASGLQMAGPHLTPYTFEHALQSTKFPNPPDPLHEGNVSFAGSHSMINDYIVAWWGQATRSPYQGDPPGSWCYAEDGRRFQLGHFPKRSILPGSLMGAPCKT